MSRTGKVVMLTMGIVVVVLLARVLTPDQKCPDGQVASTTIAGIACMPRAG